MTKEQGGIFLNMQHWVHHKDKKKYVALHIKVLEKNPQCSCLNTEPLLIAHTQDTLEMWIGKKLSTNSYTVLHTCASSNKWM